MFIKHAPSFGDSVHHVHSTRPLIWRIHHIPATRPLIGETVHHILDTPFLLGDSGSSYILNMLRHLAIPESSYILNMPRLLGESGSSYILSTPP